MEHYGFFFVGCKTFSYQESLRLISLFFRNVIRRQRGFEKTDYTVVFRYEYVLAMVVTSILCLTRSISFEKLIYCRHGNLGIFQVCNSLD